MQAALADTCFKSYWLDSIDVDDDAAALQHDDQCDLLVVRGGFCGLWAALQAREQNPERIFPADAAELERLGRENMDAFRATLERYAIDCDLEWGGEMKVSIGDQGLEAIDNDYQLYLK